MTAHAPNLVIEDDGVQHYVEDGNLHVYAPEAGVFRITPTPGARWSQGGRDLGSVEFQVAFSPGAPGPGFFSVIAGGTDLVDGLKRAMEGSTRGENVNRPRGWHEALAKRIEDGGWLP